MHMGSLKEGRKALILVSEGYTNMLPPQMRDPVASMPGFGNPARGNPMAGLNDPNEERAQFFGPAWTCRPICARSMRRRTATTSRFTRSTRAASPIPSSTLPTTSTRRRPRVPQLDDGHAARAGRKHRRPRDRQSQRSRGRHEADRARHERVLPARLQLDAGAVGRQVPRDQGSREAARRAGARAQRLLGAHRGGDRARAGAAQARAAAGRSTALSPR